MRIMMKGLYCASLLALLVPFCGCKRPVEILPDPSLDGGVVLLAPLAVDGKGVPVDTFYFGKTSKEPVWRLCQWSCRHDLQGAQVSDTEYGVEYPGESLSMARHSDGVLTMKLDASKEYLKPRTADEPWAHILIETDLPFVPVNDYESLELTYSMRILKCENRMGEDYNKTVHAAQALGYFHLTNNNPQSADYRMGMWLGVGLYDNREPGGMLQKVMSHLDKGTQTYIYCRPSACFFGEGTDFADGAWHPAYVNVRETLGEALAHFKDQGLFSDSDVEDFAFTSMNFGWEVPGTFDCALQAKDFSLKGRRH